MLSQSGSQSIYVGLHSWLAAPYHTPIAPQHCHLQGPTAQIHMSYRVHVFLCASPSPSRHPYRTTQTQHGISRTEYFLQASLDLKSGPCEAHSCIAVS